MKHVTLRAIYLTLAALLALWAASFALSYLPLGPEGSLAVALGIAAVKAVLVVLFFMELITERFSMVLALLSGLFLVALLAVLMGADVLTRGAPPLLPPVLPR